MSPQINESDLKEALNLAHAIGDDTLAIPRRVAAGTSPARGAALVTALP